MKTLISTLLVFSASTAFAHGNLASQAQKATTLALGSLQKTETKDSLRRFKSVSAEVIGHETFAVTVNYTDGNQFKYICAEDESVEPAVWGCTKK